MNKENKKILELDLEESLFSKRYFLVRLKLFIYLFQRPFFNFFSKLILYSKIPPLFKKMYFLQREGGMFKSWVYFLCNKKHNIKNTSILIPGVGFGHCIFQLAAFKPKKIIAFDIYEYKEEWNFVREICKEKFNVEVFFIKGEFRDISPDEKFDWIITDAVLEHIQDMDIFLKNSYEVLKMDGWFYASFGPIWYGPGGDHVGWGNELTQWDHLLLDKEEYKNRFKKRGESQEQGTLQADFLFNGKLFSYLKADEYFKKFNEKKFDTKFGMIKVNTPALKILKKNKNLSKKLDKQEVPFFDRFIDGFYIWLKK